MHNNAKIPADRSRLIIILPRLLHDRIKKLSWEERRSVNNFLNVHLPIWIKGMEGTDK